MKAIAVVTVVFFFVLLLVGAGCEPVTSESLSKTAQLSVYTRYTPVKIDIMPLTEFIHVGDDGEASKIKVYVSLLDAFDCQIKTPAVFRFELYEYVQRSAKPKGRRINIWPDIDLTDAVENNKHWQDFLRTYEFNLDLEAVSNQDYILQVTCLCPSGKRLSAEFSLKHTK